MHVNEITISNRTQDKTVVEFCKTVVATAPFLMPILVPVVSVTLQSSETDIKSIKNAQINRRNQHPVSVTGVYD